MPHLRHCLSCRLLTGDVEGEGERQLTCQEAAKRLEDYIRVESTITERCYILFGIYYAIIAASMGYVLSNLDKQNDLPVTYGCLALFTFSFISLIYVTKAMKPHDFYAKGRDPEEFRIPEYVKYFQKCPKADKKKNVLADELVMLQESISKQRALNEKRAGQISASLSFLATGSCITAILFIITYIILW